MDQHVDESSQQEPSWRFSEPVVRVQRLVTRDQKRPAPSLRRVLRGITPETCICQDGQRWGQSIGAGTERGVMVEEGPTTVGEGSQQTRSGYAQELGAAGTRRS